jgi:hypothetical protein
MNDFNTQCGYIQYDDSYAVTANGCYEAILESFAKSRSSSALHAKKQEMNRELNEAYSEARDEGWEGKGSVPVTEGTLREATALVRVLPESVYMPSIYALQNGKIAFEWRGKSGTGLVLTIDESKRMTYATILAKDKKFQATERLLGTLPPSLRTLLLLHFSESH